MPGYITKLLQSFPHPIPKKPEHQPHCHVKPRYGIKVQLTDPRDKTPLLQPDDITKLQKIIGDLLYYAIAMDGTLIATLNELVSAQSKGTQATMKTTKKLMDYCHTHSNSKVKFSQAKCNCIFTVMHLTCRHTKQETGWGEFFPE